MSKYAYKHRCLSLIRSSGSTSRVLNLVVAAERFGDTEEYLEKPMFRHKRLNRALIVKHRLRDNERSQMIDRRTTATKIIMPFDINDLSLGGASFFVDQVGYDRQMPNLVGGYDNPMDEQHDRQMLTFLDVLPSLDPFLMRERLRRSGVDPARCYFDISEADMVRMNTYVQSQIVKLIQIAFDQLDSENSALLSKKLAEKLLADENAEGLEPLRLTLRLSGREYREGMFAWKGFLYYKWIFQDLYRKLAIVRRQFAGVRFLRASPEEETHLGVIRDRILSGLEQAQLIVQAALSTYDRAFADLTEKMRPMAFREFLLKSPTLFLTLGDRVGAVSHICSFWEFRFKPEEMVAMPVDEAIEVLGEFESTLGPTRQLKAA